MAATQMATVTVTTAATRVRVVTVPTPIRRVRFQTDDFNGLTDKIYIGDVLVTSAIYGASMLRWDSVTFDFTDGRPGDLSEFYADATTNGNRVHYVAVLA